MSQGFVLDIPLEMLDRLDTANAKLTQLAAASERTMDRVKNSFNKMSTEGVAPFIQKLVEAKLAMDSMGSTNVTFTGISNISTDSTKAIDDVNKLVEVLGKLYAENDKLKNQQLSTRGITVAQEMRVSKVQTTTKTKELLNDERELMNAQRERERELMRADKQSAKRHAEKMARYKQEIEELTRFSRVYAQIPKSLSTKDVGKLITRSVQSDKSINQSIIAIKNLEKAKKDLDTTDSRYVQTLAKIDSEINRHKARLRSLGVETDKATKAHKSLINTADQLKRAFGLMFSVSAIKGYVSEIARVRGEFELQQRSLQAILQNKDEANKIWQQTVQLAVRSPFQVKELVTYTKQLAAYRVESDKLYDTTKMLADVSAGLGVDMNRLILAYGQVKAANYLRGTELRQFSEAGINILEELSKYFTEIEGGAVSVGEVFERVSKRMVSFADVEEIFKRITKEGGVFYNMQEIQAETLRGQISNLRDSIDIMLNDIGKANEHILKGSVGAVKAFVENWQMIVPVLKLVVAGFTMTRINAILTKDALVKMALDYGILASSATKTLSVTQLLNVGFTNFTRSIKAAAAAMKGFIATKPIIASITAVLFVLIKVGNILREHKREVDAINKKYQDLGTIVKTLSNNFSLEQEKSNVKGLRKELNQLIELANREYNMDIKIDVTDLDASELAQKFIEIREKIFDAQEFAKTFELAMQKVASWKPDKFDIFGDLDSAEDSVLEQFSVFRKAATQTVFALEQSQEQLTKAQLDALEELKKPQGVNESQFAYITRLRKAYEVFMAEYMKESQNTTRGIAHQYSVMEGLRKELEKMGINANEVYRIIMNWTNVEDDAKQEFDKLFDSLDAQIQDMSDEDKVFFLKTAIDKKDFTDVQREIAYYFANMRYGINIQPTIKGNTGKKDTTGGSGDESKMTSKRISLLKEMNREYERLNKTFDKSTAKQRVLNDYTTTFNEVFKNTGITLSDIEFDSLEGLAKSLGKLTTLATKEGTDAKIALERAMSGVKVQIEIEPKQDADKKLKEDVEELFSRYDISIDLEKLGLSKALMQSAFNIEALDLTQLRKALENMQPKFIGTDMEDQYKQYLHKLQDLEDKAAVERAKTYVKYLLDSQRDAVKIKMEEFRKIQEIEKSALSDSAKTAAKDRVRQETKTQLDSAQWADFKGSEMYTMMFEDLEYYGTEALESLRDKLSELRASLTDLPADEVKEIIRQMERINEITLQRNPFQALKESRSEIKASGKTEEEAQQDLITSENRVATLQQELDIINIVNAAKAEGKNIDTETKYAYDDILVEMQEQGIAEKDILAYKTQALAIEQKNAVTARQTTQAYKAQRSAYTATLSRTNDILGGINDAVKASMNLMDSLGVAGDSVTGILANSISSMISLTMSAIQFQIQLQAMGVAANSALGIIGWVAIAIQAVATVISSIFKARDKGLQNQIDALAKKAKVLQKRFDELAKGIDETYSTDSLEDTNKEMERTTELLIANLKAQRALEQEKKDTDASKIEELNEAIAEAEQALVDAQKKVISHATAGILDSTFDAARSFVDAWADAYAETGNGLKSLGENFEEMFLDMAKQQAALQIVGVFAERWKKDLEKYINTDDVELTKDEARNWAEEVRRTFPELNAALEGYLGTIIDEVKGGSLSGLQSEVGNMTEETAKILVAYMNSIRLYVAENNTTIKRLSDYILGTDDQVNPMLAQLRIIATQTSSIRTLLDSVVKAGHPEGNSGIRVFIN